MTNAINWFGATADASKPSDRAAALINNKPKYPATKCARDTLPLM